MTARRVEMAGLTAMIARIRRASLEDDLQEPHSEDDRLFGCQCFVHRDGREGQRPGGFVERPPLSRPRYDVLVRVRWHRPGKARHGVDYYAQTVDGHSWGSEWDYCVGHPAVHGDGPDGSLSA